MPVQIRPRAPDGVSVAKKSNQLRKTEGELDRFPRIAARSQKNLETSADLRRLICRCNEADSQRIASAVNNVQQADHSITNTELLLECALYFESIGDFISALDVANKALAIASSLNDTNLRRRCHSIVGVVLSRQCDFGRALFHLETALGIARNMSDPLYEFAVLCNIAATLPYMGLMQDAKSLSLKILAYPEGRVEFDQLHLQNALNGIKLCQSLSDNESLIVFNRLADKKIDQVTGINSLTRAYYDAYHAFGLLLKELPIDAYTYVHEKIQNTAIANVRATSTLTVALGVCALKTKSQQIVREANARLTEILPSLKQTPFHYEDVLRTLVRLSKVDTRKSSRTRGTQLARELCDHLVNVKHRQFFNRLQQEHQLEKRADLSAPKYSISAQILPVARVGTELASNMSPDLSGQQIEVAEHDRVRQWIFQHGDPASQGLEKKLRSTEYDIAEEWALSADYFADRCGHHCLEVGTLARLIALQLGSDKFEAISIDLACRLHDIGKVLVDGTIQRNVQLGAADDYLVMREHTLMGASLLDRSDNELLALAASVARSHHEWWNGSGHPDGISGTQIPMAARICAVADTFLVLLRPASNRLSWSKDCAIQQLEAMSGVQLDPSVVRALFNIVRNLGDCSSQEMISLVDPISGSNFVNARKSLLDVIA